MKLAHFLTRSIQTLKFLIHVFDVGFALDDFSRGVLVKSKTFLFFYLLLILPVRDGIPHL